MKVQFPGTHPRITNSLQKYLSDLYGLALGGHIALMDNLASFVDHGVLGSR